MAEGRKDGVLQRWWPFALVCLLASSVWLVTDSYSQVQSTLASEAVACALAAVVSVVVAVVLKRRGGGGWGLVRPAVAGAMVLGGPASAGFLGAEGVGATSVAIALSLTPVVVAVTESVTGDEGLDAGALWPGLVAVTALLLVLAPPSFADLRSDVALALGPLLTGVGCVMFRRSGNGVAAAWRVSAGLLGAAVVYGVVVLGEGVVRRQLPEVSLAAVGIDAVLFGLGMLALSRVTASQYVARYAVVPLLILLQGVLLLHSEVTVRIAACGVLLAIASVVLLRSGVKAAGNEFGGVENLPQG